MSNQPTVTVYSSPTCMPCRSTKKFLTNNNVAFREVDVTSDPDGLDTIKSLGYNGVPVLVTGDEHWQGYQPDKLAALVS